jgi:hypothetical protein
LTPGGRLLESRVSHEKDGHAARDWEKNFSLIFA